MTVQEKLKKKINDRKKSNFDSREGQTEIVYWEYNARIAEDMWFLRIIEEIKE